MFDKLLKKQAFKIKRNKKPTRVTVICRVTIPPGIAQNKKLVIETKAVWLKVLWLKGLTLT